VRPSFGHSLDAPLLVALRETAGDRFAMTLGRRREGRRAAGRKAMAATPVSSANFPVRSSPLPCSFVSSSLFLRVSSLFPLAGMIAVRPDDDAVGLCPGNSGARRTDHALC